MTISGMDGNEASDGVGIDVGSSLLNTDWYCLFKILLLIIAKMSANARGQWKILICSGSGLIHRSYKKVFQAC